jgi:predicted kinase
MSTLYITRGLPASGKTTWAKAWVAVDPASRARINRDDLRAMVYGDATDYSWPQEAAVTDASREMVRTLLKSGRDVVADDMNLRPKYVREWLRFAHAIGADVEVVEFPCSPDESIERDAARPRPVGAEVITRMVEKYTRKGALQPIPDEDFDQQPAEAYEPPAGAPPAVIVDIDGTLAIQGDRSPYDLTRVAEDTANAAVIEAVRAAYDHGCRIVFCSGREDIARDATKTWLLTHIDRGFVFDSPLLMRAAGDMRKDAVVKRELFDQHIRDHYDVRYVLDDRQQVVDMWRSLGLTVFQVAPGDF